MRPWLGDGVVPDSAGEFFSKAGRVFVDSNKARVKMLSLYAKPKEKGERKVTMSEEFEKSDVYRRVVSGEYSLRCEWCGQGLVEDGVTDAGEMLTQMREHVLTCPGAPSSSDASGKGGDDKELAKGILGWFCVWCGEGKVGKDFLGSAKKLKAAREHYLSCKGRSSGGGEG